MTAGLRQAAGDIVAIIDADLQDPVELIPDMIAKWREGFSVVYGARLNRKEFTIKVLAYSTFYRLLARISEIPMPRDRGDFCLLDRSVVNALNQLPEKNRFVRGLRAWCGGRQIGIPYDRPLRAAGASRYSFKKLMNFAFDGIFNFSVIPLSVCFLARPWFFDLGDVRSPVLSCAPDLRLQTLRLQPRRCAWLHQHHPFHLSNQRSSTAHGKVSGEQRVSCLLRPRFACGEQGFEGPSSVAAIRHNGADPERGNSSGDDWNIHPVNGRHRSDIGKARQ